MYRVIWSNSTLDALANIYVSLTAIDRERIAGGIEALNGQLAFAPHELGESREDEWRVVFVPLGSVLYQVFDDQRLVRVRKVIRYGK